jgi:hypothetical protein
LTNRELFLRAAKAKGMDRDATMKTQMQVASESILIRAYIGDFLGANPSVTMCSRKSTKPSRPALATRNTALAISWSRRRKMLTH